MIKAEEISPRALHMPCHSTSQDVSKSYHKHSNHFTQWWV